MVEYRITVRLVQSCTDLCNLWFVEVYWGVVGRIEGPLGPIRGGLWFLGYFRVSVGERSKTGGGGGITIITIQSQNKESIGLDRFEDL